MRALRLIKEEQLEFGEIPDPAAPGAHEVLVRVRAVSLNHIDLFGMRGMAFAKRKLPLVVGVECSATIETLGGAVPALAGVVVAWRKRHHLRGR